MLKKRLVNLQCTGLGEGVIRLNADSHHHVVRHHAPGGQLQVQPTQVTSSHIQVTRAVTLNKICIKNNET